MKHAIAVAVATAAVAEAAVASAQAAAQVGSSDPTFEPAGSKSKRTLGGDQDTDSVQRLASAQAAAQVVRLTRPSLPPYCSGVKPVQKKPVYEPLRRPHVAKFHSFHAP